MQWTLLVGGVFAVLLAFTLFWNRRLTREIERRKKVEEQNRLYTEELALSNVDLQQFAYVASHDLQEPLRMISGYLQLIERRYKDKLDDDANTFIHYAVDGANRLQALIGGLLEFSRVRTHGKVFAAVDIGAVLDGVCRDLQPLIVESGATVFYERMPIITGDEAQSTRLLQNLLQNALKFRKEGIPPKIDISVVTTVEHHLFCVKDNGIGIEPQYFERIFTIFQRLHTREEYPGTGIGLSICKRIVERHGGSIWLESTPGTGTSFYFSIPGDILRNKSA
jgi:light-regulated signal transduction histidine kinase (bacteriophytochrome)